MVTRSTLIYLSQREGLKEFAARFRLFKKLTTRFVAGETIEEAVAAIRQINGDGCTACFDHLNESVTSAAETAEEVQEYQHVLGAIDKTGISSPHPTEWQTIRAAVMWRGKDAGNAQGRDL